MRKTMVNDRQSDREGFRERRPIMRANIMRNGAAALLFLGLSVFHSGPAQALINHKSPDGTCQGKPEPPTPASGCEAKICTNDGDWMCCNLCTVAGGYCCNLMEAFTSQGGKLRLPGGQMETAPGSPSTGTGTVRPPVVPGTKPAIRPRGIEGEQPAEPTPGTPTAPEQPTGTK